MEEKTEQLRDLFLDVAEEETVTESQEETRGSLVDGESVPERLTHVIERMQEAFSFRTELTVSELERVVREFYEGRSDAEIASTLDRDEKTVFWARLDLHLTSDEELAQLLEDPDAVSEKHAAGTTTDELVTDHELDEETANRVLAILDTLDRARRVSYRYRTAFEEILTDADMSVQLVSDAHEDGLEEATEGAEVDVDF